MNNTTSKHWSKSDAIKTLDFISSSLECKKLQSYKSLFSQLQNLFDFTDAVCGFGNLKQVLLSRTPVYDYLPVHYPDDYLKRYTNKGYHLLDPMFKETVRTRKVENWADVNKRLFSGRKEVVYSEAEQFGLVDGFTYGIPDSSYNNWSIFWFAGKKVDNTVRSKHMIQQTTPHLSEAFKRILKKSKNLKYNLTPREIEILSWLKEGKSSWEIGIILKISERGVNFHVNNIKTKLNSTNRTQAVAVALKEKLIKL